jgi:hypothetical protein
MKQMARSFFNGVSNLWNSIPMALKLVLFGGPLGVGAITIALAKARKKFAVSAGGEGSSYTPAAIGSGAAGRAAPQAMGLGAPASLAVGVSAYGAETASAGATLYGSSVESGGYYGVGASSGMGAIPNYSLAAAAAFKTATQVSEPSVKVYIGDQELRGIVRTEVTQNGREQSYRIQRGRA